MKWSEVREHYPDQIVLVEALRTTSENKVRTVEEMSILSDFQENMDAWKEYKKLHKEKPEKEHIFFIHLKQKLRSLNNFLLVLAVLLKQFPQHTPRCFSCCSSAYTFGHLIGAT
jgi:hypothetical protein